MSLFERNEKFLSKTFVSEHDFTNEYKQLYSEKERAKDLYLTLMKLFQRSIENGNTNDLQKYGNIIQLLHENESQSNLLEYHEDARNVLKNTNLVILASKCSQEKLLHFLFDNGWNFLKNLSVTREAPTPTATDESNHNAFYYAIRSGNYKLFKALFDTWPDNYFNDRSDELDDIISSTYEELKLKNVPLTEEMEIFIERKILNLRFYSNREAQHNRNSSKIDSIDSRIDLVIENINSLTNEYNEKMVDNIFLFRATFIAQNIQILKQQLKYTYGKIPWEEMEFIVISFVSSHLRKQEINLFYKSVLNISKVFFYLKKFAELLQCVKGNVKFSNNKFDIYKANRQNVINSITGKNPDLKVFYEDFQQLRDVYSLEKINEYMKLAISSNPKDGEGQLIIIRVLQVGGEYLKNTLESPNLSEATSDMVLLLLQKDIRRTIMDLRDSLSHSYSLSRRTKLQQEQDAGFFEGVQNDAKVIYTEVSQILYKEKLRLIKILFDRTLKTTSQEQFLIILDIIESAGFNQESLEDDLREKGQTKLQQLLKQFVAASDEEANVVGKVKIIISNMESKIESVKNSCIIAFKRLKNLSFLIKSQADKNAFTKKSIGDIHNLCNLTLIELKKEDREDEYTAKIVEGVQDLCDLYNSGSWGVSDGFIGKLIYEIIFYVKLYKPRDLKKIEELKEKLQAENLKNKHDISISVDPDNQLKSKLEELKIILKNNSLGHSIKKLQLYKNNKKMQAVVEMLVLDIMSILSSSKNYLENNSFFLDDNSPLLTGKSLRNHLAHYNILLDVLLFDPSVSVILNAKKLTEEDLLNNTKKIGKLVYLDSLRYKEKYERGLIIIRNQNNLFRAAEEGDLQSLEQYLKAGSDIHAEDSNSWTALQFASKSPNLEMVKLVLSQEVIWNGQSPLHIAAAHGRTNTVEFFINEKNMNVDELDEQLRTPLHLAAQYGHIETVKLLIKYNTSKFLKDKYGNSPVLRAIKHRHFEVLKILLEGESDTEFILHEAVESGSMEIITYLIEKGFKIENTCDLSRTPLHVAALCGNFDAAKLLIDKGAKVDPKDIIGCTPLLYAAKNGNNEIVELLIERKANIDIRDRKNLISPIHIAAKNGNTEVVKTLLNHKADPNSRSGNGQTPLIFAIVHEHIDTAQILLNNKADVNAEDSSNYTPLFYAIMTKNAKIVELLLRYKVDIETTSLHTACRNGSWEIIKLLVQNGARVNALDKEGLTPLMIAAAETDVRVVDFLLQNNAIVNRKSKTNRTPLLCAANSGQIKNVRLLLGKGAPAVNAALYQAAQNGYADIVELLIEKGAPINDAVVNVAIDMDHLSVIKVLGNKGANVKNSLERAMRHNDPDMIETLISYGAEIGSEKTGSGPLFTAVISGYTKIVKILLNKNRLLAKTIYPNEGTILHVASQLGHADIVKLLIENGADVNAILNPNNYTPICLAVLNKAEEVVDILIDNGARLDDKFSVMGLKDFTLLHMAAIKGFNEITKILLANNMDVDAKDYNNDTPLELALYSEFTPVVKEFVKSMKFNVNDKICKDRTWTILHVAANSHADELDNLGMVKFIVNELGADINVKTDDGFKAIHIAARAGQKNIVKFFVEKGQSLKGVLHYAAMKGQVKVGEYLINKGADINANDSDGNTPMDIAVSQSQSEFVKFLLENGAFYHTTELTNWTSQLFVAVKNNNVSQVKKCIENGGVINAKNFIDMTPLHLACWKGHAEIVAILLKDEKCNPNIRVDKGYTPLHYAVRFNYHEIVNILLEHGVICNAKAESGKTPLDLARDKNKVYLLNVICKAFKNVEENNVRVIDDLSKVKKSLWKPILRSLNEKNETLIVVAELNKFSMLDRLKEIVYADIGKALDARRDLLGPDNVGTLDVLQIMGKTHLDQRNYFEAKKILENVYEKRKEILGPDHVDTLRTRSHVGLVMHRLGKHDESITILRDVYEKQTEILGPKHEDTYDSLFSIAMVLQIQGKNKKSEALSIYRECFEMLNANDPRLISIKNNIALIENDLQKLQEVYELKKSVCGVNDPSTLETLTNMAMVFAYQKNYPKAEESLKQALILQKSHLGVKHPVTLTTQMNLANILSREQKLLSAYKIYKAILNPVKEVYGPNHRYVKDITSEMESINSCFSLMGNVQCADIVDNLQKELRKAIEVGDCETVQKLLTEGVDINDALHFAVSSGHPKIVDLLIQNGAEVMSKSEKGVTTLHLACSAGRQDVVDLLMKYVDRKKSLSDFVNSQTNFGTTALHEAAKNGSIGILKTLLQNGAIFNTKNDKKKTPSSLCTDGNCRNLLQLISNVFEGVKKGDEKVIEKIRSLDKDMFLVISNVRNVDNKSLLQVAMLNKRKTIVEWLLKQLQQHNRV